MRFCAVILLIFTCATNAQEMVSMSVSWTEVTMNENGAPIDQEDLIYAVIDKRVEQEMCVTTSTECTFAVGQGECGSLYAVAYQLSTGLESAPSNVIDVCAADISRLNPPYLQVVTNDI